MTSEVRPEDLTAVEIIKQARAKDRADFLNRAIAAGFTASQAEFLAGLKKDINTAAMGFANMFDF